RGDPGKRRGPAAGDDGGTNMAPSWILQRRELHDPQVPCSSASGARQHDQPAQAGAIRANAGALRLARLAREQDPRVVLEPEALVEARQLASILHDDESDLEGYYLLGWLHVSRYKALPEGAGQRDREEAVAKFTPCFVFGADEED